MKLTLGFSPCPNDTFIFDALVNQKIDTEGLEFEVAMEDVETLNRWALQGQLDVTKLSYGVLPLVLAEYVVLNSGGALGKGVGPLLITSPGSIHENPTFEAAKDYVMQSFVALPGIHTTAHMLFTLAFPEAKKKGFIPFNKIEDFVLGKLPLPANAEETSRCGVIIHENRFTYKEKGLVKILDLGEFWEEKTNCPIPLGGIVIKREFGKALSQKIDRLIRKSIEYAYKNYPTLSTYVKDHSQEMKEEVMKQHIDLYVNDFSMNLGSNGRAAVWQMLEVSSAVFPEPVSGSYEVFAD